MPPVAADALRSSSSSRVAWRWVVWAVVALALGVRLFGLGMKPPHFDEGVNGFFVDQMTETGFYRYDPSNYHGPLHFYVLYLMQTLFGRSVEVLRLPLVLVSTATVWLILQYRRFMPGRVCLLAALAFAISPGMVFYGRYAIHEAWLVAGMVLAVWGAAEMWTRGSERGLWAAVVGVVLMVLTKETAVIHLVAFWLAWGTLRLLERAGSPSAPGLALEPVPQRWSRNAAWAAGGVGCLLLLFFYSGGFRDMASLRGVVETLGFWTATGAGGAGHEKPWYYWLQLMGLYEWPALVGVLFGTTALLPGMNRLVRLLAIYGWGTLVAYSLVAYKTPWCVISILWPFFFLFGDAVARLWRWGKREWKGAKWPAWSVGTVALLVSAGVMVRLNYFRPADKAERYAYVQTTNDLFKLTRPLFAQVREDKARLHAPIYLIMKDYHPLPWVLGDFTDVHYFTRDDLAPQRMDAMVILAEEERMDEVESQLEGAYFAEDFQLRDGVRPGRLYLRASHFRTVFPGREPEFSGEER